MRAFKKFFTSCVALVVLLFSCKTKDDHNNLRIQIDHNGKTAAISLCECMMENGYDPYINQEYGGEELLDELESAVMSCFLDFMIEYGSPLMQMKKKEQKVFIKGFLHALVETECFKNSVDNFPDFVFDELDTLTQ